MNDQENIPKKKKREGAELRNIWTFVIAIVGFGLSIYTFVSNKIEEYRTDRPYISITRFGGRIDTIKATGRVGVIGRVDTAATKDLFADTLIKTRIHPYEVIENFGKEPAYNLKFIIGVEQGGRTPLDGETHVWIKQEQEISNEISPRTPYEFQLFKIPTKADQFFYFYILCSYTNEDSSSTYYNRFYFKLAYFPNEGLYEDVISDPLTKAESEIMTNEFEDWHPNFAMGGRYINVTNLQHTADGKLGHFSFMWEDTVPPTSIGHFITPQ